MQQCNQCASQTCGFHAAENRKANCVVHRDDPPRMFDGVNMVGRCKHHVPLPRQKCTFLEASMSSTKESADATVELLRRFSLIRQYQKELVRLSE